MKTLYKVEISEATRVADPAYNEPTWHFVACDTHKHLPATKGKVLQELPLNADFDCDWCD